MRHWTAWRRWPDAVALASRCPHRVRQLCVRPGVDAAEQVGLYCPEPPAAASLSGTMSCPGRAADQNRSRSDGKRGIFESVEVSMPAMYLRECLIQNVGPIAALDLSFELGSSGNPKPVVLVGKNG